MARTTGTEIKWMDVSIWIFFFKFIESKRQNLMDELRKKMNEGFNSGNITECTNKWITGTKRYMFDEISGCLNDWIVKFYRSMSSASKKRINIIFQR